MADLDVSVARGPAANPAAPVELLMRSAADAQRRATVARALLDRREISPPVAQALAAHPHADIRRRLARHRSTPDEIRFGLGEDPDPAVRAELAGWPPDYLDWPHPARAQPLPVEVYRRLATGAEPEVRAALGRNRLLPEAVRVVLAGDPDPEVRRRAALRALPTALLHQSRASRGGDATASHRRLLTWQP